MYLNKCKKIIASKCIRSKNILNICHYRNVFIMGIETSCDDTGCAILNENGDILGESLDSQHFVHLKHGGIIPPIARDLHRNNIENVVNQAITRSGLKIEDLTAIATTVEPGLPMSLLIGMKYGKYLCRVYKKPFIPIHHMKAHALTARMFDKSIEYPFLVLLVSGGHCLLAIAENVEDFLLLGKSIDNSPGEIMDKIARRLKLRNLIEYTALSGGRAMELAASKADNPLQFNYIIPLLHQKNCNFSFAGLHNQISRMIESEEKIHKVDPDEVIPSVHNLCAGFLLTITRHLCHRVQRAMEFIELKNLIPPERRILVMSGGVACNNIIPKGIQMVCDEYGYKLVRPPPKLCTDNGVMIAWNGVERWKSQVGVCSDLEKITIKKSSPIGKDMIEDLEKANISCKWIKVTNIMNLSTI
ncbi:probable tRNA N6-adenosine threonylcarbamoyltransferase, mitochondrial [Harmonia axyridis]|uniref:probable tRNA N6-adenosine threonylcarbamoyltransferase, mitochondrial n=1 Tax=Harmonia axyridis TaxID=115357 RepID=UPI001E277DC2|nr:probable tRNA N6-adenosine threonylcarbamoyltransferase, mitochondrial [Harmonia axyridis]